MKRYIRSDVSGRIVETSGRIAETGEPCKMRANGFWVAGGKKITSWVRTDKEIEYTDDGTPVRRQYTMDRQHRFWVETEDEVKEYETLH